MMDLTPELAREWQLMLVAQDELKRALRDESAAKSRADKHRLAIQKHGDTINQLCREKDDVTA
jgi:hypothetical protein